MTTTFRSRNAACDWLSENVSKSRIRRVYVHTCIPGSYVKVSLADVLVWLASSPFKNEATVTIQVEHEGRVGHVAYVHADEIVVPAV